MEGSVAKKRLLRKVNVCDAQETAAPSRRLSGDFRRPATLMACIGSPRLRTASRTGAPPRRPPALFVEPRPHADLAATADPARGPAPGTPRPQRAGLGHAQLRRLAQPRGGHRPGSARRAATSRLT